MSVPSTVLLIAGSPSESSRSAALLDAVSVQLARRSGLKMEQLNIRELPAQALLLAEWGHLEIVKALAQVQRARAIVVATPVYKAAYSGVLKVFLDLLPQTALKEKTVLPLATGGSPNHMLALDYALRPVLQSLSARQILPGVYATDAQIARSAEGRYTLDADIATRLDEAVVTLLAEGFRMPQPTRFDPVLFSQVRCSV
ncbi:MAG: reductase [Polaromonas sp.]|nr:reductase [Polaromonas sp.]